MDFQRIGRNCFNPKSATTLSQYNLEVWPGFYSAMQKLESGPLIMIDLTNKVIRRDSVLSFINDLSSKNKSKDFINDQLKFAVVVTSYGQSKKTYRVSEIDFNRSPISTFKCGKEEKEITFAQYYKERYGTNIQELNQPLLISKSERTGQEIALIPELCEMTGLTDSHRANFNLMKDLSRILHKDASTRKAEATKLIQEMQNQKKIKELINQWGLEFDPQPFQIEGQKISGGDIIMGKKNGNERSRFQMECQPNDFDRNIQQEMYTQVPLNVWGIFFEQYNSKEADVFINEIKKCFDQFKYDVKPPQKFQVRGKGFQGWQEELKKQLNPSVQLVVCIAPGQKGKSPIYDQLKSLLIGSLPVPCQVVLANTISKGKNLRSICNKILIQMNAKIGGEPWAVSNMPFLNKPTMIVGYDVHHKRGQKSLLAFCATINQNGNKYWSRVQEQDGEMQEIAKGLQTIFSDAMEAFKKITTRFPEQIIIYRDGVGDAQKQVVMKDEIEQIQLALKSKGLEEACKFLFVMVNKRVKTKFVLETNNNRLDNPRPGTFVDHSITPQQNYDFFLVSQNCRQGVATPSHYSILYDSIKSDPKNIIDLTYRLCYLYYNFSGPVKIPGPVKYADKLANMIGEKGNVKPHVHYEKINGLYYI